MLRGASLPVIVLVATTLAQLPVSGQPPAVRGFTSDALAAQRTLEERFRAVPDPARLREYMQAMSAEPHVAGRPGSKVVADYALAKFKSFGLEATIEEYRGLHAVADRAPPRDGGADRAQLRHPGAAGARRIRIRSTTIRRRPSTPTPPTATSPAKWST